MLSLKIIFISCRTTTFWRKMQITLQLNLNETSQKKNKAKANTHFFFAQCIPALPLGCWGNTHVVLYYK